MSYRGFGKGSGPSAPPQSKPTFGSNPFPRLPSSSPSTPPGTATFLVPPPLQPLRPRFIESSVRSDGQKLLYRDLDALPPEGPIGVTTFASRDSTAGVSARVSRYPSPEMTRSPPVVYVDDEFSRKSSQTQLRNPAIASATLDNRTSVPDNYPNVSQHNVQSSVSPYFGSHNPQRSFTKELNSAQVLKRSRSPPSPPANKFLQENFNIARKDFRRPSISPPRLANRLNFQSASPQPQIHQKSLPSTSTASEAALSMPVSSTAPKRTRSPPLTFSADEALGGNSISSEDNAEREMLAKAKRLARFKVELNKSEQNSSDFADQKASANRHVQSTLEQKPVGAPSMELTRNFAYGHNCSDHEGSETSSIIIGLCPDMCPESERAERERKGDLDQYERLDGDRNVTSRFLAVKKYNRTAEREASLIRPMPILWKTIDYLLSLLDQPYDERFLGIYNFLWDRMRAIRMDLRMQHIFNQGAIAMLEQMIRLHIIAMHELCEYTKGEGFSEGFDAHLNIEQMNKTSVELFQMYDDHRKKGIDVPTEREFRGYYALLKLDKHPGYKVEPAELSLDLAQMTSEIRQTPEILFARNVARACRTGNFIAFFRFARKASYLQACLMHAHFAKLRTQALASLHSGLPNNQGLPVSHVAEWLAMEDEDIEGLLEYHGFSLKTFEEPYMVKEGPFLNADNEYPTKCSKLVHKKRSGSVVKDVSPSVQVTSLPVQTAKEIQRRKTYKHEPQLVSSIQNGSSVQKVDEEMPDSEAIVSPKDIKSGPAFKDIPISIQHSEKDHCMASPRPSPFSFSSSSNMPALQHTRSVISTSPNSDANSRGSPKRKLNSAVDERPLEFVTRPAQLEISSGHSFSFSAPISPSPIIPQDESLVIPQENDGDIDEDIENYLDKEVAEAKLKLFLRLWRRQASKLRMLREQRQLAANAALDSLSLGPPIRHYIDQPGSLDMFDINKAMRERYDKQQKSWARINVSEIVAGKLSRRNSDAKCLCWKVILCSQMNSQYKMGAAGSWLISKLMPSSDDDVVASSPGLAIWKKWVPSQPGADPCCCISVVRDTTFGNLDETVSGASAVLFLVSESISWELQKAHLHKILMSIPSDAHLPLLILCGSCEEGVSSIIINSLGLKEIDNSRVSGFLLVFLIENQHTEHLGGFFSDKQLREGLEWLAGESPLQPTLHCVKSRELIHTHLNSLSGGHDSINNPKLGPNDCISLFNAALDYSAEDIIDAANSNPTGWPGPEIALLGEFSDEDVVVKRYLPAMGWSSNAKIEPIIRALQECKFPAFPHDLSWLAKGSNAGHEIESHRSKLENSLTEYLTHTTKMMGESLATKEARVMLQTCARLQLYGSSYQIVPLWSAIFRRIFNWRLTSLSIGESSSAYISECHHTGPTSSVLDPGFEAGIPSSYYQITSLDETIEVGCNSPLPVKGQSMSEALRHPPQIGSNGVVIHEIVQESDLLDRGTNFAMNKLLSLNTVSPKGSNNDSGEALISGKTTKEADRLSKLLEQCDLLQDVIGEKLSVFF